MMKAMVMCGTPADVAKLGPIPSGAEVRECHNCGCEIVASPTSLAIPDVTLFCNPCGKAAASVASKVHPYGVVLGIAPGALDPDSTENAHRDRREVIRRRKELEAWGFQQVTKEDLE